MKKRIERQTLHLSVEGELDMNNADELKRLIDSEIDKKGIRTVVLHMDDLTFIDSSGLGVILGRYKKLLPLGGKILIANVPPHLYNIMELSGLPKIIDFIPEEKAQ
ncbi:MAG: STAS domain-containing protein [Desulfitobacteriia bacterium]|jgi:stage II sporulation protein AA (anti-sigma F factor antagonist)